MLAALPRKKIPGLEWVDRLKGIAMLWVVLNHGVEQLAGGNLAGDPTGDWPPLSTRVAQFASHLPGLGLFDWPVTGLRDIGWLADQAVSIFIVLSGFGLALGLIASGAGPALDWREFLGRRLRRIYPAWWGAHILFLPTGYLFASGLSTGDWQYYASFLGLRSIPSVFYYFSSSWWYVGVIIQLYLAFPLLWRVLRTHGPVTLLASSCLLGFFSLAIGHAVFHGEYVEMWQRGICAVTRLPEFAFGMAFAFWWAREPARSAALLRRPAVRIAALGTYAAGFAASFALTGMIFAPTMLGIAAIVLLYPLVAWRATGRGALEFIGRHSFTIYLTHQYLIWLFVRPEPAPYPSIVGIALALAAIAGATFLLEYGTARVEAALRRLAARHGRAAARSALAAAVIAIVALPLVAELSLRTLAPYNVAHWSERVALRPDSYFGWHLAPSRAVRLGTEPDVLRASDADGFTVPARVPAAESRAALRVLVVGDAISSTGVDSGSAWPQLLQNELARSHRAAEVANLAVIGYGPTQEALVARAYAPRLRPDFVLVEVAPGDVRNVLTDTPTRQAELGLDRPPPTDVRSLLSLESLRRVVSVPLKPLADRFHRRASLEDYTRGAFVYLERGHDDWDNAGVAASAARYGEIAAAARRVGARTILVFMPGPAQVCDRAALAYYPPRVDLTDISRYDVALPERRARRMAAAAHLGLWDLTSQLRARLDCPFEPHGSYLRPAAQREIATLLAPRLLALGSGAKLTKVPEAFERTAWR